MVDYIKKIYGIDTLSIKIIRQIQKYRDEYHYSYSGIHKTLIYVNEVKHKIKVIDGIGIVPYYYEEAKKFYENLWAVKSKNANKNIKDYTSTFSSTVIIPPPQRDPMKRTKFSFLDEDIINDEQ